MTRNENQQNLNFA